ncbi:hypothetical protein [Rhodohalobacter mucosus]|uniref:6-bladed beta-propeller protein n=1 Tax=Rhodohalobacter mucosus TaxID=2079485 RepID=A0A316TWI3_9BACT|nr:hypothetical protein [Rhodohalobacter mucosus]PWN06924.1 hypothetical protein DDZ15_06530 [Rhodohalobacter mucosus]
MKRLTYLTLLAIILLVTGCMNSERSELPESLRDRDPLTVLNGGNETGRISLQRDIAFKDSLLLDRVNGVAVDESGAVLIAGEAWERREVYRFETDGTRTGTFGGYGRDEGEFLQIDNIQFSGGRLHVYDGKSERITVLDAERGELTHSLSVRSEQYRDSVSARHTVVTPIHRYENGTYLIGFKDSRNPAFFPEREVVYATVSRTGELLADSVLIQSDSRYLVGDYAGKPAAFMLERPVRPLLAADRTGRIVSANTSDFILEKHDPEYGLLNTIYHRYERAPLDKEEIVDGQFSHNEQILRVRQTAEYPERWPALYSMVSDDGGRIWVSAITEKRHEFKWYVIHSDGRHSTFLWPSERKIVHVEGGYAYVVENDENGFEDVVRYIIREEGSAE